MHMGETRQAGFSFKTISGTPEIIGGWSEQPLGSMGG